MLYECFKKERVHERQKNLSWFAHRLQWWWQQLLEPKGSQQRTLTSRSILTRELLSCAVPPCTYSQAAQSQEPSWLALYNVIPTMCGLVESQVALNDRKAPSSWRLPSVLEIPWTMLASTGQAVSFIAPPPANEESLKKSEVKQCSWSDCPQNPSHHCTEIVFYWLCHWNLGLFLHLAQFSNLDKEPQVPFSICKMGRAFSPCLHVAHRGCRVLRTLLEQISQSPQCQHLPLATMALPGCWHWHVKDYCITLFKMGHFRISWPRLSIPFQKTCISLSTHITFTWAQPEGPAGGSFPL